MAANLKRFLQETTELQHPYKRVEIFFKTKRYTTLPLQYYEDDSAETLFYQNLPKENNEHVICNILQGTNIVVLFSIDKLSYLYLSEYFPNARFMASVSPQVECLMTKVRTLHKRLYVNIEATNMEVYCLQEGRLLLLNTYDTQHHTDRVYYILQLWQSLQLSQTADELCLVGEPAIVEELSTYFSDYIKHVNKFQLHEALGKEKAYEVNLPFDLQTLLACE